MARGYLSSGQRTCHDTAGREVECAGSGQDGEHRPGVSWPEPRFVVSAGGVEDRLTGLIWSRDATPLEWPLPWTEALERVVQLDTAGASGDSPWRLPNRRELRSLISFATREPALPERHPFCRVSLGWYWTSTTAAPNPAYAWYVHTEGGRMFYGRKDEDHLVWPVRGVSRVLPATGQRGGFDASGREVPARPGEDGGVASGAPWPEPRFVVTGDRVLDRVTALIWRRRADLTVGPLTWQGALDAVAALATATGEVWRLPTINELESLVDASAHHPALPRRHPFAALGDVYWSSTTSGFEPDWAMALYLDKGAVGVGQKKLRCGSVWPVRQ